MFVVNAEQMRAADAHAIEQLKIPSLTLMENAATAVTQVLLKHRPQLRTAVVVCGKGNNGGDGMAVACLLKKLGWSPAICLIGKAAELKTDPAFQWRRAQEARVPSFEISDPETLDRYLMHSDLIIDAIFGTGLSTAVAGPFSEAIQRINRSGTEVISIDVPSGVSSDSGELLGPAIRAHITVALAALKYCHVLAPANQMAGEIYVADIGIPVSSSVAVITVEEVRRLLPRRKPDSHKGTYGHAVIIAGSTGKSGAAYMAGKAALRAGAGLATVVSPAKVQPVIASLGPEIMTRPAQGSGDYFDLDAANDVAIFVADKSSVAIGPGVGTEEETKTFLHIVAPTIPGALLIDADGLNLLARDQSVLAQRKPNSTVLTPHPGEMARLLGIDNNAVQKDRILAAATLASQTKSVVVLKGYRTIIANPEGRIWINLTGGPALASAGTGDILTGILVGFMAQKLVPLEAAIAGVFLHGFASNLFEMEFPHQAMNAMDILQYWNRGVEMIRTAKDLEGSYLKVHFNLGS